VGYVGRINEGKVDLVSDSEKLVSGKKGLDEKHVYVNRSSRTL